VVEVMSFGREGREVGVKSKEVRLSGHKRWKTASVASERHILSDLIRGGSEGERQGRGEREGATNREVFD
jgi:hypothetical protein